MKRILFLIAVLAAALVSCKEVDPVVENGKLTVDPQSLSFKAEGGSQILTLVTDAGSWTLDQTSGTDWCLPARTSGKTSTSINVTVIRNTGSERMAELVFSAPDCADVKVTVSQEAGSGVSDLDDLAEGLSMDPATPDADAAATLFFKAGASSALSGYSGDVYVHAGVIVDGEWMYVPAEWNQNLDKCRMTAEAENVWSLKFEPSVREWFASGKTPVNRIGLVIRSADGSLKGLEADTFFDITDNKYQAEVFEPDPVVEEAVPAGAEYGININSDNSVTFVLAEKDKSGNHHEYCYLVGDFNDWERNASSAMKRDNAKGAWWLTVDGLDPDKEYRFQYRVGTSGGSELYLSDPYTEIVYDQWNDQYISSSTYPDLPAFPEKAKALVSAFRINEEAYNWKYSDFKVEDDDDLVIYELLIRDFSATKDLKGVMDRLDHIEALGVNAIELMPVQEFDGNLSWGYNPNHYFALDKAYGTREMYKDFIDECHRRGIAVIIDVVYNHLTGLSTYSKLYYQGDKTASDNPWFNVDAPHPFSVFHDINHENELIADHIKQSLAYLLNEYDVDGFRFDLTKGFTNKKSNESSASNYDASRVAILKGYYNYIMSVKNDAVVILEHFCEEKEEKELVQAGMKVWRNCNGAYRGSVLGAPGDFSGIWTGSSTVPFGGYVGFMESHDEERLCYGAVNDVTSVSWGVCGTMTNWSSDLSMAADGPFFVARNVSCTADDRFKIRGNGEWNDAYNYGAASDNFKLTVGEAYELTLGSGSKDMYVPAAGSYDIYFCPAVKTVWLMNAGDRPAEPEVDAESEDPHAVAMRRAGCNAAFCFTVPGPKMIWQFGEIGYDISIEYNGRTGEKPVVTDSYMADPDRKALYDTYAALIGFRRDNPRFFDQDADFKWTPSAKVKTITCTVDGKTFHVVGNFDTVTQTATLPDGQWRDYLNDNASFLSGSVTLRQGEFKLLVNF